MGVGVDGKACLYVCKVEGCVNVCFKIKFNGIGTNDLCGGGRLCLLRGDANDRRAKASGRSTNTLGKLARKTRTGIVVFT